jgi:hypothetical protein
MLDNFKRGYTGDYRVELTPPKPLEIMSNTLGVLQGWIAFQGISGLRNNLWVLSGSDRDMPGRPHQFPYIDIWQLILPG